jgi:hypothetical protein
MQNNQYTGDTEDEAAAAAPDGDEFKYLKFDWYSHDERLKAVAHKLAERWKDEATPKRRSKRDFESAFNVVLTALEVNGFYDGIQIRIPIYNAIYCGVTQRSPAHTSEVYDALCWLKKNKYLLATDGRRVVRNGSGGSQEIPFAYTIGEKWRAEVGHSPMSSISLITRNPLSPYVQVRTKLRLNNKRKPLKANYSPTNQQLSDSKELIDTTNRVMVAYDALMARTSIKLDGTTIAAHRTSYTRVFNNGGFEDGGRFYCALQGIKSQQRLALTFDGDPVAELDYAGLHPTMLYELEGLEPHPAPYEVEGFKRGDVKVAFNILVNRNAKIHSSSEAQSIQKNLGIAYPEAQRLRDALYELHQPIVHRFNEGFGLKLQRLDSDIALKILDYFVHDLQRPILMVHDSAVVSVRDAESLLLSMSDLYQEAVNSLTKGKSSRIFDAESGQYEIMDGYFCRGNGVKVACNTKSKDVERLLLQSLSGEHIEAASWDTSIKL